MEEKDKKSFNKMIVIIITLIIGIGIGTGIGYIIFNNDNDNNNHNDNSTYNDDDSKNDEDNNNVDGIIKARSSEEFLEYLNSYYSLLEDKDEITIKYENIKLILSNHNDSEDFQYLTYDVYYNDKKIEKINLEEKYDNEIKSYLLKDNRNNAFMIVAKTKEIASHDILNVTVIDTKGNLLLDETFIDDPYSENIIDNNSISFSYETKMQEDMLLDTKAEDDIFCQYLNENYIDDYVVKGNKKYQYTNKKMSLIEDEKVTIKNYKEKYNCK